MSPPLPWQPISPHAVGISDGDAITVFTLEKNQVKIRSTTSTRRRPAKISGQVIGNLVMGIGGGHHRPMALDAELILDPAEDSPLASIQPAVDICVHSKATWRANG